MESTVHTHVHGVMNKLDVQSQNGRKICDGKIAEINSNNTKFIYSIAVLQVTFTFRSLNGDLKIFLVAISKFLVAMYKTSTRHDGNRVNETCTSFHPI
jgi:hypothetical protein